MVEEPVPLRPEQPISQTKPDWNGFVAFVGKEKKFLASHLETGTALELSAGRMKIGVSERHHLAFLQDSDNLATLRDLAKRFFAQETAVQVVQLAATESGRAPMGAPSASAGDERSPMVKEALRIFGGSVRNARRENS
jgi:hypothetical protein